MLSNKSTGLIKITILEIELIKMKKIPYILTFIIIIVNLLNINLYSLFSKENSVYAINILVCIFILLSIYKRTNTSFI